MKINVNVYEYFQKICCMLLCPLPSEKRGVRGEDGGEVELPDARHDEADAAHPLVEVRHDPVLKRKESW